MLFFFPEQGLLVDGRREIGLRGDLVPALFDLADGLAGTIGHGEVGEVHARHEVLAFWAIGEQNGRNPNATCQDRGMQPDSDESDAAAHGVQKALGGSPVLFDSHLGEFAFVPESFQSRSISAAERYSDDFAAGLEELSGNAGGALEGGKFSGGWSRAWLHREVDDETILRAEGGGDIGGQSEGGIASYQRLGQAGVLQNLQRERATN